jgi:alpha-amylase
MTMAPPQFIRDTELTPLPGKTYFTIDREWREEFIYFLLVDRFHDDADRAPVKKPGRSSGIETPDDFYGGKIKGITRNLDYIAGLGCTAIWLSPVFENNPHAYHGYNINNYLDIDPNFGTTKDLIDLVEEAHHFEKSGQPFPIRIILDIVTNHSGDNWAYREDSTYRYWNDQQFDFGFWRGKDRPIPQDLRNPDYYHRRGQIQNYDAYPETQHGDIVTLKDYANEDDQAGSELINILIKAHAYWIREADVDGFRVDAVKHMGDLACSRLCSNVREYAYALGKRGFFLYGELASPDDDLINRYIGQNTSRMDPGKTVFFGLDSILDFRLAGGNSGNAALRDVIKGFAGPETLFNRLEAQRERALNRGEVGRYLVSFVDNHDSFWQPAGRIGAGAPVEQIIAAIGYLLCSLGTPCIYYGTEQGFGGSGGDNQIREAMFDKETPGRNLLNSDCTIKKSPRSRKSCGQRSPYDLGGCTFARYPVTAFISDSHSERPTPWPSQGYCTGARCWSRTTYPTKDETTASSLMPPCIERAIPCISFMARLATVRWNRVPMARFTSKSTWLPGSS